MRLGGGGGGGGVLSSLFREFTSLWICPGLEEASSGAAGTRVNYISIFPADGVGNLS